MSSKVVLFAIVATMAVAPPLYGQEAKAPSSPQTPAAKAAAATPASPAAETAPVAKKEPASEAKPPSNVATGGEGAEQKPRMRLLDPSFASLLCKAWNKTRLPVELGRSGTEWIDSNDSEGLQVIVITRSDCKGWRKVRLVVKADDKGNARCVKGGAYDGRSAYQWKFEPSTEQWADFTDGFGVTKMPGIMSGFEGSYATAMNNISNFEIFFAAAGRIALDKKVDWACKGADMEDVNDEIADIDKEDMREILGAR